MGFCARGRWKCRWLMLAVTLICIPLGCSPLPRQYLRQAEPGVTLTTLVTHPDRYRGKVVALGGVIVEEKQDGNRLWLRMKNRPLDEDYRPHRPAQTDGLEAGHYWVVVTREKIPASYRKWARVTVVGQVSGVTPIEAPKDPAGEPVLSAMYLRGWGGSSHDENAWEEFVDPNYLPRTPSGIHGEFGSQ